MNHLIYKLKIDLKFDATLSIKSSSEWELDTIIPFNGSWKYNSISEFSTTAPDNAQDLSEMISSYLWGMMWWNLDSEDYEGLYSDDIIVDNIENWENIETTEATESTTAEQPENPEE